MPRAATDVMQSILFSAVLDAIAALKTASKGLPNQLLRDVQAIHSNVTFADLPKELQDAINTNTRGAFTQLLKEGYAVAPRDVATARPSAPRQGEVVDRGARGPRPPARGPRPGGGPGGGPRPARSGPGGPRGGGKPRGPSRGG